jgi:hypothetical protein
MVSLIANLIMNDTDGYGGIGSGTSCDMATLALIVALVGVTVMMHRRKVK